MDAPRLRQVAYVPGAWLGASAWEVAAAGDGELLMGLGALATVALQRPPNLAIVALDNGRYGETGMLPSHTAGPTRLAAVAPRAASPRRTTSRRTRTWTAWCGRSPRRRT